MFLKHLKWATPFLLLDRGDSEIIFCSNPAKGRTPSLCRKILEVGQPTLEVSKWLVTFEVRPLGESGLDGRNPEGKRAQRFPSTELELSMRPGLVGPRGFCGCYSS